MKGRITVITPCSIKMDEKEMEKAYENGQKNSRPIGWYPDGVKWQFKSHYLGKLQGA